MRKTYSVFSTPFWEEVIQVERKINAVSDAKFSLQKVEEIEKDFSPPLRQDNPMGE